MTHTEARRILGVTPQDDFRSIKMKYRKLMRRFHPDSSGDSALGYHSKAQEINLAYELLKDSLEHAAADPHAASTKESTWQGEQNPHAYTERNIYQAYHMDPSPTSKELHSSTEHMFQHLARGKYYWDPDEEDFPYFMKSIYHVVLELLRQTEDLHDWIDATELESLRLPYQVG